MIRLGLIGCGEHSEGGHAVPLARYKAEHPSEIELAATCDPRLERAQFFCANYGFQIAYSDMNEMLARHQLDACIAVVPVEKIPQVGIQLLERRMPCSVEKPLGASLSDVQGLYDSARATGTPNMVSVNRRFMPFLNRALDWVRQAGSLRYVRCTFSRHARSEPEFLWGTAVHAVDALRHTAGEIADASIRTLKPEAGTADWYAIDLDFVSGVSGHIDVLPTSGLREETYELIGEGFRAVVTCPFGPRRGLRCYRENQVVLEEYESEQTSEDVVNGFYDEAVAFIRALTLKQNLRPSIEDVFPSVQLCLSLAKTAEQQAGRLTSSRS
ncbi:MAG TPA: Gfo/Idh/MocA family oxidoreductase [Terriglobales bacterium]|nr:Gfo/Idh/MocA family oxidoreductase [Terriglobales bacterium]